MTIQAVTFDFWNTLVHATTDRSEVRVRAWQALLADAGPAIDASEIRAVFDIVWERHQAAWTRNEQYDGRRAATEAADLLGIPDAASTLRAHLAAAFVADADDAFSPCPGVVDVIGRLSAAGVRLGIICDVGFTPSTALRDLLDRFGVLGAFAGWSFSDEVGWYKPSPVIFDHARSYLGADATEIAHIGDLRRTDVAGARSQGWTSVRYRGVHDDVTDGPEGDHVVDDYATLLDTLGL